jgi:hypothetical protein
MNPFGGTQHAPDFQQSQQYHQQQQQQQQQQQKNPVGSTASASIGMNATSLLQRAQNLHTSTPQQPFLPNHQSQTVNQQHNAHSQSTFISSTIPQSNLHSNQPHKHQNQHDSIFATLEANRNQIIHDILFQQKQTTLEYMESQIQNRIYSDWNQTRNAVMKDLVVLNDVSSTVGGGAKNQPIAIYDHGGHTPGTSDSSGNSRHNDDSNVDSFLSINNNKNSNNSNRTPFYELATYLYENKLHSIVDISHELSLNQSSLYSPYHEASKLITVLNNSSTGTTATDINAYNVSTNTATTVATVKERTISSLVFLANNFSDYIMTRIKNNTTFSSSISEESGGSGSGGGGGGFKSIIMKFVEMEMGRDVFRVQNRNILFKCMYYSLRCGDAHAALELFSLSSVGVGGAGAGAYNSNNTSSINEHGNAILKQVLEYLVHQQQQHQHDTIPANKCVRLLHGLNTLPPALIAEMKRVYDSLHLLYSNNINNNMDNMNEYEVAVLGMLSFSDISHGITSGVANATIEDHIYLALWNALSPNANMTSAIIEMGERIKASGSEYFEGNLSNNSQNNDEIKSFGFTYAMPLLLCQCYKSAIVHIARTGQGFGLCLAIQMVLELNKHNSSHNNCIMLVDLVDEQRMAAAGNENELRNENNSVVSTLLVAYSKELQAQKAMALEYLLYIPDTVPSSISLKDGRSLSLKAEREICNLILESGPGAYQFFAGKLSSDGARVGPAVLDQHFTPSGVSDLLTIAGNHCIHEGKVEAATDLLSLAGNFSTLLSLLNNKLASLVYVEQEEDAGKNQQRHIWWKLACSFQSIHLTQPNSRVVQVLEAEKRMYLGRDFELLLNLMVFFDKCNEGDWNVSNLLISQ